MAAELGISNSRVSNWEQGINRPDAEMIANICRVLDVSPSELLGVSLDSDNITVAEKRVIRAYRDNPELQHAIHILLGLEDNM